MKLRDSQQIALERLCEPDRTFAALWAEPRSGKTAVALQWLQHISPPVSVVVAPKVAEATWRAEAAKWLEVDYRFFPLTAGNTYPEISDFRGITILFVNYDQFGKAPFKRLKPFLQSVAKWTDGQGAMLLDESHMIKSPSSITGRNIRPLARNWKYRLLMTGTPVTNPSQVDAVYGQWTFLDPEIRSKWPTAGRFREYFGEWTTYKGFPELVRPIRQAELNAYLQPNVVTMTGAANPVKIILYKYKVQSGVHVALDTMLKEGIVELEGKTVIGLNPLTRLLRMRMIASGWFKDDQGHSYRFPKASAPRLKALGKVLARNDGKTIVACTHLFEVEMVKTFLTKKGIKHNIITGVTKDKNREIENFQMGDSRVLVVQPRTVSMAVDISVANMLVWFTSDFNYVTFKQTSDRIKLSPVKPTVYFLCAEHTVDEDVWITLRKDHSHLSEVVAKIKNKNS